METKENLEYQFALIQASHAGAATQHSSSSTGDLGLADTACNSPAQATASALPWSGSPAQPLGQAVAESLAAAVCCADRWACGKTMPVGRGRGAVRAWCTQLWVYICTCRLWKGRQAQPVPDGWQQPALLPRLLLLLTAAAGLAATLAADLGECTLTFLFGCMFLASLAESWLNLRSLTTTGFELLGALSKARSASP